MAKPDNRTLTGAQARRLAALSGIPADQLAGLTVRTARSRFAAQLPDPTWLLFQRISGRVVGAPSGAVIEVAATECDIVTCFPYGSRSGWLFPHRRRDTVIASAPVDARNTFELWLPRFDVDFVVRWRRKHYCFDEIFDRPVGARLAPAPAVPAQLGVEVDETERVGPFHRGTGVAAKQWDRLDDVPDLTVRITVDGEPIHVGRCFDIAWPTADIVVDARHTAAESVFERVS